MPEASTFGVNLLTQGDFIGNVGDEFRVTAGLK